MKFFSSIEPNQCKQYKSWLSYSSTSLRSHILNQNNFSSYPFLSSLFVGQMGMQNLLYSKSFPSFLTKLNLAYYVKFSSLFVLKSLTRYFLILLFLLQRTVHNISHACQIHKSCTTANAAMLLTL